jgi:cysteine desulfurase
VGSGMLLSPLVGSALLKSIPEQWNPSWLKACILRVKYWMSTQILEGTTYKLHFQQVGLPVLPLPNERNIMKPIYLDYNATTPIDPEVAEAMLPFLYEHFGNPSSSHIYGRNTRKAVERARGKVGDLINCQPDRIVFTSGGTESNNHAIRGAAFANAHKGKHIIISSIEHPAVTEVCKWLTTQRFDLTILPVDHQGLVHPADLERHIRPDTILVSVMHANNEVGTIQPIAELAAIAHKHSVVFHTDAAQTPGKIPVDVNQLGIDLLSIAGHKLYAPKGVGALYVGENTQIENLMFGANQERGCRPGTENTLEIVGLGEACQIAQRDLEVLQIKYEGFKKTLYEGLLRNLSGDNIRVNGHPTNCLPNTLSISFLNIAADKLLHLIQDEVAASAGSACHADQIAISPVLKAMNIPLEWAAGTVRLSVGRKTTNAEILQAVDLITRAITKLQSAI